MAICTIKQGQHGSDMISCPWLFKTPSLVRYVRFSDSCAYTLDAYNQLDVNKLYGASFGLSEDNSARFGWRFVEGMIELVAYVHDRGQLNRNEFFDFPVVMRVDLNDMARCEIKVGKSDYLFQVDVRGKQNAVSVPHSKLTTSYGVTRGLWFGGSQVAPHDMTVEIDTKPL